MSAADTSSDASTDPASQVVDRPAPQQLRIAIQEAGMPLASCRWLIDAFAPFYAQAGELTRAAMLIPVPEPGADSIDQAVVEQAAEMRGRLKTVRTTAEKVRVRLKAESLARGNLIDRANRELLAEIAPAEKRLLDAEDFAHRKEMERRSAIVLERGDKLRKFGVDPNNFDLPAMSEEAFQNLLTGSHLAHTQRQDQLRIEREDAAKKEAARVEAERKLKAENERLRKEKADQEEKAKEDRHRAAAKLEKERKAHEAENARVEAAAKKEREAAAKKHVAEQEAAAATYREESAARLRLEKAEKARKDAEAAKKRKEAADARKAAAAPDKVKLQFLAAAIEAIPLPTVTSEEAKRIIEDVADQLKACAEHLIEKAQKLGEE